jgi:5-formyltetrahydrofolate cyclo-ligase
VPTCSRRPWEDDIPTASAAPHSHDELKQALRKQALLRRATCDPALGTRLGTQLLPILKQDAIVSGFWPMPGELDIRPLLHALHARGSVVALPETPPRGRPLIFRRWTPETTMLRERFGTFRPEGDVLVPDTLLVPLLAFDRRGNRLGYGGGYYDRTLAALPGARAIGCAFAALELDEVPVGEYDAPLHAVATELGVIDCERP